MLGRVREKRAPPPWYLTIFVLLQGTHIGWTCPQVKDMVTAAMGGCLFLDEAYALSGTKDGDRGDSFADEVRVWPLDDIAITNIECCMAYKRGVGGERALRNSRAKVLQ